MLCWFLLYNEVNQLYVYVYPLSLGPPEHVLKSCTEFKCSKAIAVKVQFNSMVFCWLVIVAKSCQQSQEGIENVDFFLQMFATRWKVMKTFSQVPTPWIAVSVFAQGVSGTERGWLMKPSQLCQRSGQLKGYGSLPALNLPHTHRVASPCGQSFPVAHTKGSQRGWEWFQEHSTLGDPKIWRNLFYLLIVYFTFSSQEVSDCV